MQSSLRWGLSRITLVVLLGWSVLQAQDRISEEEINVQKLFIDAHKERLLGNYDKAIGILEEMSRFNKETPAVFFELSKIYELKEEKDKAIEFIQKAVDLDRNNEWYQRLLAKLYQDGGQFRQAADVYENLVRLAPKEPEHYYMWAFLLVQAKDLDKAIRAYDQLELQVGFNEEIARRRHTLYMGKGKTKRAGKELERLVELFPNNTDYRHLLATFYENAFERDAAVRQYQEILRLNPYDSKAQIAVTGNKALNKNELQYLSSLQPIFEQSTVSIDLKLDKIIPLIKQAAESDDRALATTLLELTTVLETVHPDDAKAFAASGDLLAILSRLDEAKAKFEETLKLDDSNFTVWEQLMFIQLEQRDYQALVNTSEQAMDFFPNKVIAYYYNGLGALQLGQSEESISILSEADLMTRKDLAMKANIKNLIGNAYRKLGNFKSARAAFEEGLELIPDQPNILSNYSRLLAESGRELDRAVTMAEQAVKSSGTDPDYQGSLGFVLYRQKNYEAARKAFEKALADKNGQTNIFVLEEYGNVLFQMNEIEEAISYWKKALDAGSNSPNLRRKIADRKLYE